MSPIFMSAHIGGLAEFMLARTVGDIAHIAIEADEADPAVLISPSGHVLSVVERVERELPRFLIPRPGCR